jgi:XTP/dITP diphosphohydrolase
LRVVLASKNVGKLRELRALLAEHAPHVELVDDVDWDDVEETEDTFEGNAFLKADDVHAATGLLALADDSGLEIDALDGAPGVYSARWSGADGDDRDAANVAKALRELDAVGAYDASQRTARFRCVIAIVGEIDGTPVRTTVEGVCEGTIIDAPRGADGFGYDPVFVPTGWDRTFAEASPAEKSAVSHRGAALRQAVGYIADFRAAVVDE